MCISVYEPGAPLTAFSVNNVSDKDNINQFQTIQKVFTKTRICTDRLIDRGSDRLTNWMH